MLTALLDAGSKHPCGERRCGGMWSGASVSEQRESWSLLAHAQQRKERAVMKPHSAAHILPHFCIPHRGGDSFSLQL